MSEAKEIEVARQRHDGQSKFAYYLLTAAGAGIGFSVTQTKDAWLNIAHLPLGIAIFIWALSFYYGCEYLRNSAYFAVLESERLKSLNRHGLPTESGYDLSSIIAMQKIVNKKLLFQHNWQFRLIIAGAGAFLAWHILEMYLRASNPLLGH